MALFISLFFSLAQANEALLLTGYTIDSFANTANAGQAATDPSKARPKDRPNLATGDNAGLERTLRQLGIARDSAVFANTQALVSDYFKNTPPGSATEQTSQYSQLYLSCMMSLATESGGISVRLPNESENIILERWDHNTREAFSAELPRKSSALDSPALDNSALNSPALNSPALDNSALNSPALNSPALDDPALNSPALDNPALDSTNQTEANPFANKLEVTEGEETLLGFQTQAYTSPAEIPALGPATEAIRIEPTNNMARSEFNSIAVPVNMQQSFTAWIAKNATGQPIISAFVAGFTYQLAPEQQDHWLYQGKLQRQIQLLPYGLPLHLVELEESRVGNTTLGTRKSESWASSLQLIDSDLSLCDRSSIPEGFQVSR